MIETKQSESHTTGPVAPATILVVEDDEGVRGFLQSELMESGFHVLCAPTATDAMRIVEERCSSLKLVITDSVLPEMRGAELVRLVRQQLPAAPVVFTSGYFDAPSMAGIPPGCPRTRFLQKPFTIRQLLTAMQDLMEGTE
jgi:two-component system, cell cycle sensor histidine kinase and response regulator CckA